VVVSTLTAALLLSLPESGAVQLLMAKEMLQLHMISQRCMIHATSDHMSSMNSMCLQFCSGGNMRQQCCAIT
jgi:hypothetical protein